LCCQSVTVPTLTASAWSRWANRIYFTLFACYLAGLLLWLLLGLLPSVVFANSSWTQEVHSLARGNGALSGLARSLEDGESIRASGPTVAAEYLFSLLNLALGVLITARRPYGAVPRLLALACIGTAATFNEPSHVVFHLLEHAPVVTAVHFTFHIVSGVAYLWAVVLFPDATIPLAGRVRRRWLPWTALAAGTALTIWICYRSSFISHPPFFVAFFGILVPIVGITAQTARLVDRSSAPVTRQQAALLRAALTPALAAAALWLGAHAVETLGWSGRPSASAFGDGVQAGFPAVFAVVPLMLFVAIVRYRLWDIDTVISRTLVYTLLVGTVVVAYGAALAVTEWLVGDGIWSTLVAFGVVAVLAEPARQWSRRLANRLVFGTRFTPRDSIRALAERLSAPTSANELVELAELVVASTRCRAARVWLVSEGHLMLVAAAPDAQDADSEMLPAGSGSFADCVAALPGWFCTAISHEGRLLAVLAVEVPPRVALPPAEAALIRDLAGHAGLLVANARLATELAREVAHVSLQAAELVRSRQRVVAAGDAARRRLERDIHDGAQQDLVAALIQIRALARSGPGFDAPRVALLRAMLDQARRTIEELCRGGRPAALVEDGLAGALEAVAETVRRGGLSVTIDCRLAEPLLPDVEAAVYFCCLEAIQNSVKHAHAHHVTVEIARDGENVVSTVRDDGVGFEATGVVAGSGLRNLEERMSAVGGTVEIDSRPGAGTTTRLLVPWERPFLAAAAP
jgi:signal transduction histidine kinase